MTSIVSKANYTTDSNTFTLTNGSTPGRALVVVAAGRFWRNGELMNDIQMQTLSSATDTLDWIYLFSYWNGDVPQAQHCYTDDWKITSDRNETVIDPVTGFPWIGV